VSKARATVEAFHGLERDEQQTIFGFQHYKSYNICKTFALSDGLYMFFRTKTGAIAAPRPG
jgi:hypothetical protein